jgi:hypothetical protein
MFDARVWFFVWKEEKIGEKPIEFQTIITKIKLNQLLQKNSI